MSFTARITAALLLAVLVPILTIGVGAMRWSEQILIDRSLFHLESVVEMQGARIQTLVDRNLERHGLVASRTQLRRSLQAYNDDQDQDQRATMVRILVDALQSLPEFERITVLDVQGRVAASTDPALTSSIGATAPFVQPSSVLARAYALRNVDGRLQARIGGPLTLDGQRIGSLVIDASTGGLTAITRDFSGLLQTGETLLARREPDGAALFLTGTRLDPDAGMNRRIPSSAGQVPITRALTGNRGTFSDTLDYRGRPVLAATTYLPGLDWGVVAKMDRAEVLDSIDTARLAAIGVLMGTCALVVVLVFSISRALRAPLRTLMDAATTVGLGDLSKRVELASGTEFAEIGDAFNRMTDHLRESRAEVEHESARRQRIEQRYRKIIESAPTAMILCDSDGRIELVNLAAERLFDYARRELLGQSIETLLPDRVSAAHPAHRAAYFHAPTSRAMGVGRDLTGRRKDGTEVPIEIGLNPIQTEEGTMVLSAIVDLTERRRFESDLMLQNQRLEHADWLKTGQTELAKRVRRVSDVEALAEQILDFFSQYLGAIAGAVYVSGTAGPLRLRASRGLPRAGVPREFRLGEGLVGQAARDRTRRILDNPPQGYLHIESGLGNADPSSLAVVPVVHGKRTIAVLELAMLEPVQHRHEELFELTAESIAIAVDVALTAERLEDLLEESQEKSRALEQASAYKSAFLANMSHELRTPLNSLLILAGDLAANIDQRLSPEQQHSAEIIERSGRNLLALINDILDMSKIEAGRLDIFDGPVAVRDVVHDVVEQHAPIAAHQRLDLAASVDAAVPAHVVTDRQRLGQILTNLLSNALKFTSEGGVRLDVYVTAHGGEERINFAVVDTGIGIDQAQQEMIFGAFNQVDRSRAREFGGTGLGLAISQQLAGLLDGSISLSSSPGTGSTFTLTLPLRISAAQPGLVLAGQPERSLPETPALTHSPALQPQPQPQPPATAGPDEVARKRPDTPEPGVRSSQPGAANPLQRLLLVDADMRRAFGLSSRLGEAGMACEIAPTLERAAAVLEGRGAFTAIAVVAGAGMHRPHQAAEALAGRLGRAPLQPVVLLSGSAEPSDGGLSTSATVEQLREALAMPDVAGADVA